MRSPTKIQGMSTEIRFSCISCNENEITENSEALFDTDPALLNLIFFELDLIQTMNTMIEVMMIIEVNCLSNHSRRSIHSHQHDEAEWDEENIEKPLPEMCPDDIPPLALVADVGNKIRYLIALQY